MRRRLEFAAPFVIVTAAACGQPAPVESPPGPVTIEGLDHVRNAERARADGGVAIAVAPPIDASADLLSTSGAPLVVTIVVPAYTEQPKGYISCHDFGPGNRGCNPPRPQHHPEERYTRRILAFEAKGQDVVITVDTKDTDKLEEGMGVWARTRTDVARTRVGYVDDVGAFEARLVVALSEAEVRDGRPIDIQADASRFAELVTARIIGVQVNGHETIIIVGAGAKDGVEKGWKVEVVRSGRGVMPGGDGTVTSVTDRSAKASVTLTPDQIRANPQVRMRPR